jgi:hypothetical protein
LWPEWPEAEHIPDARMSAVFAAASAWDIDGASDAIRTARHAIQAAKHLVSRFLTMRRLRLYWCDVKGISLGETGCKDSISKPHELSKMIFGRSGFRADKAEAGGIDQVKAERIVGICCRHWS